VFEKSAEWYDALYSFKDYQKESEAITDLLKMEHPQAKTILDVACGTGEHDKYLSLSYEVDGVDINSDLVQVATGKNPEGKYVCADMMSFHISKRYDAVLCLFSSIGYLKTIENVVTALDNFERHLATDGIVVVEPWFEPEAWKPDGTVHMLTGETPEGKICRMNISERAGSLSVLNFNYLVGTRSGVEYFTEHHELGLFSVEQMKRAFESAGLKAEYSEEGLTGRGLYLARKDKV
jgi:ubiquinone/menaquinone biosynthesis C-methylase UbiE